MTIDHIAIWTNNLEQLKDYYVRYFNGVAKDKYTNKETHFESYFLSFSSGSRLEIMKMPGIPEDLNDRILQHQGIIHLSFGVDTMEMVTIKSKELARAGFKILRGPRVTGDGYYEFETLDPDNNRIEVTARFVK
ncbi:MAG: VOC family protein [Bacteroidota bacterium]